MRSGTANIAVSKSFLETRHIEYKRGRVTMRLKDRIVSKAIRTLSVLLLAGITSSAQDFQIRTRVDLVVVPVTVKGSNDQLVNGLSEENFTVYEDGRQQKLSNFTIDPVPLSAAVL